MTQDAQPSPETHEILTALQRAVADALEKKRRLGQYAVIWKDGQPVMEGGEAAVAQPSPVIRPPA